MIDVLEKLLVWAAIMVLMLAGCRWTTKPPQEIDTDTLLTIADMHYELDRREKRALAAFEVIDENTLALNRRLLKLEGKNEPTPQVH
jgi:outer membrane lipopolysaccharide assembly protein LptE/RlpB